MKLLRAMAIVLSAAILAGCAPSITVQNNTRIPVRAIVTSRGGNAVLSPSPGESSNAEVGEGRYTVTVIPDAEWIAYAKQVRQYLNDQLANSDRLTGAQLLDVIRRLKDIAEKMQQYEQAAGAGARCSGTVTSETDAVAQIAIGAGGALTVSCQ